MDGNEDVTPSPSAPPDEGLRAELDSIHSDLCDASLSVYNAVVTQYLAIAADYVHLAVLWLDEEQEQQAEHDLDLRVRLRTRPITGR